MLKLIFQIFAALIAVWHGGERGIISNPNPFSDVQYIVLGRMAIPVTVLWIVIITNSVNLIDGLDGLAVGVSAIACVTMLVISLVISEGNVVIILAALTGACIGFMPYNINPAKDLYG
jgi:UDP-GlcNAc:undecaprenyl-phosphate GlcNAc-1-phosphate transferase